MTLVLNSLAHFLVDALSVTALFSAGAEGQALTLALVLYNTLAFSSQCLVGLLIDRVHQEKRLTILAMGLTALANLLPLTYFPRVCMVGIANAFFHVAAGSMTIHQGRGKATSLGVFVAPGAFGVTLGTLYPRFSLLLSTLTALLCVLYGIKVPALQCRMLSDRADRKIPAKPFPIKSVLLLTLAVAVRAVGGAAVCYPWKNGVGMAFLLTGFVFCGKALGGFVCDRLGAKRTALLSIPAAAVCAAFFPGNIPLSLLGQLLLNLTMPVTLWLLCRALPDEPAFAFGLAASALWPGTIAGMLFSLTGPALWACILLSFGFGLFAILYSAKHLLWNERENFA